MPGDLVRSPAEAVEPGTDEASEKAARDPIVSKLNEADPEFTPDHPLVRDFVRNFSTRSRRSFQLALTRSGRYVPDMISILEEEGVPAQLVYLPLIESGFRTNVRSHAGAVGPWQFVSTTGKRYGLRIDWYVDERRDPVKSTRAAARYLKTLYEMFGSWHLSLAAYNTGEVRITRVMNRRGADTFWEMLRRGYLHRETRSFVPQFLAALQIAREPEKYGFEAPTWQRLQCDEVRVERSLSLRTIAKMVGVPLADVKRLNPALVRGLTPPGGYWVRLPYGKKRQFTLAYAEAAAKRRKGGQLAAAGHERYRIRRGDTPITIASRFGVSVEDLMLANGWSDARFIPAGQVARIPGAETAMPTAKGSKYRVRAGDTPSEIAERFGVSLRALMRANGWRHARQVRAGQIARIPGGKRPAAATATIRGTTYQIRSGDTPITIARRFGVPVKALMNANGWKNARRIRAGKTARIPPGFNGSKHKRALTRRMSPAARPQITYRVRRGDTPSAIARRFGVALDDLMAANDWRDPRRIRAGDLAFIPPPAGEEASLRLASRDSNPQENLN